MKTQISKARYLATLLFISSFVIDVVPSFASVGSEIRISQSHPSGIYVLSIGIDKYESRILSDLRFSVADAVAIGDGFEKRIEAGGKRIHNFAGSWGRSSGTQYEPVVSKPGKVEKHVIKDAEATRENIAAVFDSIAQRIEPQDIFVFSFSGQGTQIGDEFVLFTPKTNDPNDLSKSIRTSELQSFFRKIRAKNKLIILDSCDSAAGYEALSSAFIEEDTELRKAVDSNVLFIGTDGLTYEDPKLGHGVLTQVILDGIKGDADLDGNGIVSVSELESYVYCGAMKYRSIHQISPRTIRTGSDFNLVFTDRGRENILAAQLEAEKKESKSGNKGEQVRAKLHDAPVIEDAAKPRDGDDYALLFANDKYDNPEWETLKNPKNDVNDIAKELREKYRFKEIVIKENLTTKEIRETLVEYQNRKFERPDDQLFIFFAGHGVTHKVSNLASNSYYVGRSSPPFTIEDSGHFLPLESILQMVAAFQISHVMTVFDTCYAGQIWKPSVATLRTNAVAATPAGSLSFGRGIGKSERSFNTFDDQLIFAKRTMNNLSRIVLTSGKRPVLDAFKMPDGSLSRNSPFADRFLGKLREGGNPLNHGVLTATELYSAALGLPVRPMVGQMGGSDGDFVFVRHEDADKSR